MGSRQGNTVEPFLRFSVPREEEEEEESLEKRTRKKERKEKRRKEKKKRKESGKQQRRKRLTTSQGRFTVNCLTADSGWPSSFDAGVTFLIRFLAELASAINALLTRRNSKDIPFRLSRATILPLPFYLHRFRDQKEKSSLIE